MCPLSTVQLLTQQLVHTIVTVEKNRKFDWALVAIYTARHRFLDRDLTEIESIGFNDNYRPQGEGNVFTSVCLSTMGLMTTWSLLSLVSLYLD